MKEKYCDKFCKKHGLTKFVLEGRGYYRCLTCRRNFVLEHRRIKKEKLVSLLGGKCELCGYNKYLGALDFHHKDPSQKKFALSVRGLSYSWETCVQEARKCMLLCANCHREIERNIGL